MFCDKFANGLAMSFSNVSRHSQMFTIIRASTSYRSFDDSDELRSLLEDIEDHTGCNIAQAQIQNCGISTDYELLEVVEDGNVGLLVASGAITAFQGHCIVKTLAVNSDNSNNGNKNKQKPSCAKTKKDECQTSEEEEEENVDDNSDEED
eukprot:260922_1